MNTSRFIELLAVLRVSTGLTSTVVGNSRHQFCTVAPLLSFKTATRISSKITCSTMASMSTSSSTGINASFSSSSSPSTSKYFTVAITGANGLIGTALQDELLHKTKNINGKPIRLVKLSRGSPAEVTSGKPLEDLSVTSVVWNPYAAVESKEVVIDPAALNEFDALIHLSGENISTGLSGPLKFLGIRPWTEAKKKEIIESRTITTNALAKALVDNQKSLSFLVASGVGAYGPEFVRGVSGNSPAPADESMDISQSKGFLAEVSRQWEAASQIAKDSGSRVVNLRNGVVLSTKGGAMAKLYPIFFLGGGGIVGSGQQYFPFISARDMARAMVHVLNNPHLEGPVNMCAPNGGCTNAEFTAAMGKIIGRPTVLPFPAFAVRLLFGEMGEEVLLGGTRAEPRKLLDSGFQFLHPSVEEAVQSAVNETI